MSDQPPEKDNAQEDAPSSEKDAPSEAKQPKTETGTLTSANVSSLLGDSSHKIPRVHTGIPRKPTTQNLKRPAILTQTQTLKQPNFDDEDDDAENPDGAPAKPKGLFSSSQRASDDAENRPGKSIPIAKITGTHAALTDIDDMDIDFTPDAKNTETPAAASTKNQDTSAEDDESGAAKTPLIEERTDDATVPIPGLARDPLATVDSDTSQPDKPTEPDTPQAESAEPEITYHYRVAVVLNPNLELQINVARQNVEIPVAAPGIFALQTDFTAADPDAVEAAIKTWAGSHLPLHINFDRVDAQVIGEQRYAAGIALEPAAEIQRAQAALAQALEPHIQSLDETPFAPRLTISDHTPARVFPRLVHALENHFELGAWTIQAVELLRTTEGDTRWEVVEKFPA